MSEVNITKLLNDAYTVRDAVTQGANTASRVGTLCVDIINSLKELIDEIADSEDADSGFSMDSFTSAQKNAINSGITSGKVASYDSHISSSTNHVSVTDRENWNAAFINTHTHPNRNALDKLTLVDGKLKIDCDVYATGGLSAYGDGEGSEVSGVTSFDELTDVVLAGGAKGTNKVWGWNGTDYTWLTQNDSGAKKLRDLTDVGNSPQTGEVLYFDGTTFSWKTISASSSGGSVSGASSWSELTGDKPNVSVFPNDAGYITSSALDGYLTSSDASSTYVPINGNVTINGTKTFTSRVKANNGIAFYNNESIIDASGNIKFVGGADKSWNLMTQEYGVRLISARYEDGKTSVGIGKVPTLGYTLEVNGSAEFSDFIKLGNAYISFDATNNALKVTGKDGAQINFYATGGVSAYNNLGGFSTLSDLTITNLLTSKKVSATDSITSKSVKATDSVEVGDNKIESNKATLNCVEAGSVQTSGDITVGGKLSIGDASTLLQKLSATTSKSAGSTKKYLYLTIDGEEYRLELTKMS